jgi:hypothetical protein
VKRSNLKSKAKKAPKAHAHFADCSFRLRLCLFFLRASCRTRKCVDGLASVTFAV